MTIICPIMSSGLIVRSDDYKVECLAHKCAIWDKMRKCCGFRACNFVYTQEVQK